MWFYGIYLIIKSQVFTSLKKLDWPSASRPVQSTAAEVGRLVRSTDVHKRARQLQLVGRSTGRSTFQRVLLSLNASVDWPVDRQRALSLYPVSVDRAVDRIERRCSLFPGPVDRAVDRWHNDHNNDRWSVDRKVISDLCCCQRADLFVGYKYQLLWAVSTNNFKSKNPHLLKCFRYMF